MARRSIYMTEVNEIIFRWHRGEAKKSIARSLGSDPKTVRKFICMAQEAGIDRDHPLPPDYELAAILLPRREQAVKPLPSPGKESLAPYYSKIEKWAKDPAVSIKQIWRLLKEDHPEFRIGYTCLREFVQAQFRPVSIAATVPLLISPGKQGQVDFGYAGLMHDPKTGQRRKAWAFVMTLSYSRYRFVCFVFRQDAETWVDCHRRAFEFFRAVPGSILLDNLKAGVIKPDLYDPVLNKRYQEAERHYGFAADPCKIKTPNHKGRVERGVASVKQQFLAGREFADINEANERALHWCREEYGLTAHGTTGRKPREAFEQDERSTMLPLPTSPLEHASWQKAIVHQDHIVVCKGAYYSVPTRFIGKEVWVRASNSLIRVFLDELLIKSHLPVPPGHFQLDYNDFPEGKRFFLLNDAPACREKAQAIGPFTSELINRTLKAETNLNLRKAQGILRFAEDFGPQNLEGASRRALHFGSFRIDAIRKILEKGLALASLEDVEETNVVPISGFARPASYFAHG